MSRRNPRRELDVLTLDDIAVLLDSDEVTAKQKEGIRRLLAETIRVEVELRRLRDPEVKQP